MHTWRRKLKGKHDLKSELTMFYCLLPAMHCLTASVTGD